ncbi:MAG: nuclear transport factor 2 family protein [Neptuniibacter sp.]
MDNWLPAYAQQLSNLTRDNLPLLFESLATDVEFRDPFNHSYSRQAFLSILEDMFTRLNDVSFTIHGMQENDREGSLYWTFSASSPSMGVIKFEGMSRVVADEHCRIILHHDFWDASELMQKIPVLGTVIRQIRKKLSHT